MRWRVRRPLYTRRDAAVGAIWGAFVGAAAGATAGAIRPEVGPGTGGAVGAVCGAAVGAALAPLALAMLGSFLGYAVAAKFLPGVVGPEVAAVAGGAFTLVVVIALGVRALERPAVRTYPGLGEPAADAPGRDEGSDQPARHMLLGLIRTGPRREREVRIRLSEHDRAEEPVSQTCPFCLSPIESTENTRACPRCETVHHHECWRENGGCTVYGCTASPGR